MTPQHIHEDYSLFPPRLTKTEMKLRSIHFNNEIEIQEIPNVSEEDGCDYWMDKDDYQRIREECASLVRSVKGGTRFLKSELRGLEHKISGRRTRNKDIAIEAVLEEQSFQAEMGYSDEGLVASIYREMSHRASVEAKIMGMRDEVSVSTRRCLCK